MDVYGTSAGGEQAGSGQAVVSGWRGEVVSELADRSIRIASDQGSMS